MVINNKGAFYIIPRIIVFFFPVFRKDISVSRAISESILRQLQKGSFNATRDITRFFEYFGHNGSLIPFKNLFSDIKIGVINAIDYVKLDFRRLYSISIPSIIIFLFFCILFFAFLGLLMFFIFYLFFTPRLSDFAKRYPTKWKIHQSVLLSSSFFAIISFFGIISIISTSNDLLRFGYSIKDTIYMYTEYFISIFPPISNYLYENLEDTGILLDTAFKIVNDSILNFENQWRVSRGPFLKSAYIYADHFYYTLWPAYINYLSASGADINNSLINLSLYENSIITLTDVIQKFKDSHMNVVTFQRVTDRAYIDALGGLFSYARNGWGLPNGFLSHGWINGLITTFKNMFNSREDYPYMDGVFIPLQKRLDRIQKMFFHIVFIIIICFFSIIVYSYFYIKFQSLRNRHYKILLTFGIIFGLIGIILFFFTFLVHSKVSNLGNNLDYIINRVLSSCSPIYTIPEVTVMVPMPKFPYNFSMPPIRLEISHPISIFSYLTELPDGKTLYDVFEPVLHAINIFQLENHTKTFIGDFFDKSSSKMYNYSQALLGSIGEDIGKEYNATQLKLNNVIRDIHFIQEHYRHHCRIACVSIHKSINNLQSELTTSEFLMKDSMIYYSSHMMNNLSAIDGFFREIRILTNISKNNILEGIMPLFNNLYPLLKSINLEIFQPIIYSIQEIITIPFTVAFQLSYFFITLSISIFFAAYVKNTDIWTSTRRRSSYYAL